MWQLPDLFDGALPLSYVRFPSLTALQMVPFRERIGKAANGPGGIGPGLNLPHYGSQADCVYGVNPSAELLHFAETRPQKTPVPVKLLCGSGEALASCRMTKRGLSRPPHATSGAE
jgi:hypothetical protein